MCATRILRNVRNAHLLDMPHAHIPRCAQGAFSVDARKAHFPLMRATHPPQCAQRASPRHAQRAYSAMRAVAVSRCEMRRRNTILSAQATPRRDWDRFAASAATCGMIAHDRQHIARAHD